MMRKIMNQRTHFTKQNRFLGWLEKKGRILCFFSDFEEYEQEMELKNIPTYKKKSDDEDEEKPENPADNLLNLNDLNNLDSQEDDFVSFQFSFSKFFMFSVQRSLHSIITNSITI